MNFIRTTNVKIKPNIFFIVTASVFGLMVLLLTPPFQVPDEVNHFYRAYQISEGHFVSKKENNRVGGNIPKSLIKITYPFLGLCWNMHAKTNSETIIDQLNVPLNTNEKTFVDIPSQAMYSPVSYLPQATSIFILRNLNLPPLYIFYGTRIFTFLIWLLCVFNAIKIIPFYKWFFTLIALLPMSLFINMSLSADVAANYLSFLLIAYILKTVFSDSNFTLKNFLVISLLSAMLASAKLAYSPLILLLFFIPVNKFRNKKTYFIQFILFFIIVAGVVFLWSKIINNLYTPYIDYNEQFRDSTTMLKGVNMYSQMHYIMRNGWYIFHVFIDSIKESFNMYMQGYIGTFGWLDTKLPMWFIYLSYFLILLITIIEGNSGIKIKWFHKIILFISFVTVIFLIILSQSLTWEQVGSNFVWTIQGRYLIPALPLFFMLFYNSKFNKQKFVIPVVVLFSVFSLSFTVKTIHDRYFVEPEFNSVMIQCDAENVFNDSLFITNCESVFMKNKNTQSDEKSRSGKFSLKLSEQDPYGFSLQLNDCKTGDVVKAEVWRFGNSGSLVLSGGISGKDFYVSEPNSLEQNTDTWRRLSLRFIIPDNMKSKPVEIYVYNLSDEVSYFDDFMLEYLKLK